MEGTCSWISACVPESRISKCDQVEVEVEVEVGGSRCHMYENICSLHSGEQFATSSVKKDPREQKLRGFKVRLIYLLFELLFYIL